MPIPLIISVQGDAKKFVYIAIYTQGYKSVLTLSCTEDNNMKVRFWGAYKPVPHWKWNEQQV